MKLSFIIQVSQAPYGAACDACEKVSGTVSVRVLYGGRRMSEGNVCQACLAATVDLETEMDVDVPRPGHSTRAYGAESRRLEKVSARDLRGAAQPGSGCSRAAGYKGDIRKTGQWRIEHKFTNNTGSFRLQLADMTKIARQTDATELPALIVEFRRYEERFVVIPFGVFKEVVLAHEDS